MTGVRVCSTRTARQTSRAAPSVIDESWGPSPSAVPAQMMTTALGGLMWISYIQTKVLVHSPLEVQWNSVVILMTSYSDVLLSTWVWLVWWCSTCCIFGLETSSFIIMEWNALILLILLGITFGSLLCLWIHHCYLALKCRHSVKKWKFTSKEISILCLKTKV